MKRIGMVVAVEIASVFKKYENHLKPLDISGFHVYQLNKENYELYIVQSGAGEIKAAAAVQMLIDTFQVEFIVNYGVAGALTEELSVAHTCVVEKVVHYDWDVSEVDHCEVGRYIEYDDVYIPTTPKYVQMLQAYNPSIKPVICASGDKFVGNPSLKAELHDVFHADICEMEAAAIVLICDLHHIPNVLIKTISDSIMGGAKEFKERMEETADMCLELVDQFLSNV